MGITIEVAGKTDIGNVRSNNEDNFGYDTRFGIFVVCDGMGGQAAGEVASKLGVDNVLGFFRDQSKHETSEHNIADVAAMLKQDNGRTPRAKLLSAAIGRANTAIHK